LKVRTAFVVIAALAVAPVALAALAAVSELPGERAVKERLGFEYDRFPYGVCDKVHGDGPAGRWQREAPLPVVQDEARAVVVGDGVFIAGGVGRPRGDGTGETLARFVRYDLTTRRYERLPDLPLALNHVGLASHRGSVYLIGGQYDAEGQVGATNRVFRFDVATRRWRELPSMAEPRGAHGVAVVGDRIVVIGGRTDRSFDGDRANVGLVEIFDTRTERWSRGASMPAPRDHLGVATLDRHVYVLGGRLPSGRAVARLDRLDPASGDWTRLGDAPKATSGVDLLSGDGFLYTAGGEVPLEGVVLGGAWIYQPRLDRWEETARLPEPRHGYASVLQGDRIVLFGGSTCPGLAPTRTVFSRTLSPR
jgi:hypothetical protein